MPKRSRKPQKAMASINVVPYIDVMLVLLIIFMVTAPLMTQGLNVSLPQVSADAIDLNQEEPVVVTINKAGETFLNIHADPKQAVLPETLTRAINTRLQTKPRTPVLLRGDKDTSHGAVIAVMAKLKQAGIKQVGIMTEALEP